MKQLTIIFKSFLFLLLLLCFVTSTAGQANALSLNFGLDMEYSGGTAPSGTTTPWITADFIDVGLNNVQLTMSTDNLTGSENVKEWYFNFDDSLDLSKLNLSFNTGDATVDGISKVKNDLKADGDGKYDFMFAFSTTGNTFSSGETVVYDLTYTGAGTMDVMSFDFLSSPAGGHGPFYSAAHVQNTGGAGQSGWISNEMSTIVPEPISSTLFLVGAATLGFRRFRKANKA